MQKVLPLIAVLFALSSMPAQLYAQSQGDYEKACVAGAIPNCGPKTQAPVTTSALPPPTSGVAVDVKKIERANGLNPDPPELKLPAAPDVQISVLPPPPPDATPSPSAVPAFQSHAGGPVFANPKTCKGPAPPGAGALWGMNCAIQASRMRADERRALQAQRRQLEAEKSPPPNAATDIEARKRIAREFIATHPEYLPDYANNAMLNRYLLANGLEFSVANLEFAAAAVADKLEQRAAAPDDDFTRRALAELSSDRDTAASLRPMLDNKTVVDAYNSLFGAYRDLRQSVCAAHPEMQVPAIDGTPKPCR